MIIRQKYLDFLIKTKDTEFIKVITGIRRSGKSYLLKMYEEYLLENGIDESHILYINMEEYRNEKYTNPDVLYKHIKTKYENVKKGKFYIFIDEIQEVENWQRLINGIRVEFDSDIYITGSNASLLSGELATYLSGRYIEIHVYPLSFKEYIDFRNSRESYDVQFYDYIENGGFPSVVLQVSDELRKSALSGILDSIILKDVFYRGKISDEKTLNSVIDYVFDNIGNIISGNKIANYLTSNGNKVTNVTVDKYLSLLEKAFIIFKAERYDIRGKERLKNLGKYYIIDNGLRNKKLVKTYKDNLGSQVENIVYIELKRRGYEVNVGKYNNQEIDFIIRKDKKIEYFQVTRQIPDDSRESGNLLQLPDNFKKTIITANRMDVGYIDGIEVKHVVDFLLEGE